MNKIYVFGNTTVRSAKRFPQGIRVLKNSNLNGNINSKEDELAFAKLLDKNNVVDMTTVDDSLGRKWRSAFDKIGLITPASVKRQKLNKNNGFDPLIQKVKEKYPDLSLSGKPYEVTPQGSRLAKAENIFDMEDTMLRALLAVQIDTEKGIFKPFVFVLQVIRELENQGALAGLNRSELLIVFSTTSHDNVKQVVKEIINYRRNRNSVKGKRAKSKVDREILGKYAEKVGVKYDTAITYGDPNFKYMLATGIFSRSGSRIIFNNNKSTLIKNILIKEPYVYEDKLEYYYNFWKGYPLPTDNKDVLIEDIKRLSNNLNISINDDELENKSVPDLKQYQLELEKKDLDEREKLFAKRQDTEVDNIITYFQVLNGKIKSGDEYENARDDMPAFLEWATWRAFLAIDGLKCDIKKTRGFNIDQDFFPAGNAPGGMPDILLEFKDYILVVEVTLTTTSRQEAAEAEPVRRHVAQIQERCADKNKPVYGLFIAKTIDNNTAEMFRTGLFYRNEQPFFLNIVPITIDQFVYLMSEFKTKHFTNQQFERLLEKCLIPRNATVPLWKNEIQKNIDQYSFAN